MIKTKRKLNKQAIINLRRYVVVSNTEHFHYFKVGDIVQRTEGPTGTGNFFCTRLRDGLTQHINPRELQ